MSQQAVRDYLVVDPRVPSKVNEVLALTPVASSGFLGLSDRGEAVLKGDTLPELLAAFSQLPMGIFFKMDVEMAS